MTVSAGSFNLPKERMEQLVYLKVALGLESTARAIDMAMDMLVWCQKERAAGRTVGSYEVVGSLIADPKPVKFWREPEEQKKVATK